jgi:hypothetical protein
MHKTKLHVIMLGKMRRLYGASVTTEQDAVRWSRRSWASQTSPDRFAIRENAGSPGYQNS